MVSGAIKGNITNWYIGEDSLPDHSEYGLYLFFLMMDHKKLEASTITFYVKLWNK